MDNETRYINDDDLSEEDAAIRAKRRQFIQEAKRRRERRQRLQEYCRRYAPYAAAFFVVLVLAVWGIAGVVKKNAAGKGNPENGSAAADIEQESTAGVYPDGENAAAGENAEGENAPVAALGGQEAGEQNSDAGVPAGQEPDGEEPHVYSAKQTAQTKEWGEELVSSNAIFIDLDTDTILAGKDAFARIVPASMTKVLTVLVAAEHIKREDLDDTFTITLNETDYSYVNDCSSVGFAKDETVTVRDLFYGTILPSGGDAAAGLAAYVAGSREAFVELMNEKLEQLGLSETAHVTNCVGIYHEDHYCTPYDMAMIMEAALDNEICREVMSAHTYTTSATEQHPEGITISNWFLRRIEDRDTGGEVICGKTGFVVQSGNCAVSYGKDQSGREYVCVTAGASSVWRCIEDHVSLYKLYAQ